MAREVANEGIVEVRGARLGENVQQNVRKSTAGFKALRAPLIF